MHHLDNTDDFKESREEVMQSQRRRQSSFPPADGDEAAILLEKANIIRLEKVHQDALSIQESPPPDDPIRRDSVVTKTFRRLRRGSRSPSPRSLLPAMLSKRNKSKSSADLTDHCDSAPARHGSRAFWGDSNGRNGCCAERFRECSRDQNLVV